MVEVPSGANTGTSGDDTLTLSQNVSNFTLDGWAGADSFSADIKFLNTWSFPGFETLILSGSKANAAAAIDDGIWLA